jgi:hypothetical protein
MNMNKYVSLLLCLFAFVPFSVAAKVDKPWNNGRLTVSENHRYLVHQNGTPFFWLGNTSWLLPERLNRDEVEYFLTAESEAGFNVEQIQVLNAIPTYNVYGQTANNAEFDFKNVEKAGVYGYWDHLDYIVNVADKNGIYIAMDCIWGSMVSAGQMNVKQAQAYGTFLGNRWSAQRRWRLYHQRKYRGRQLAICGCVSTDDPAKTRARRRTLLRRHSSGLA